MKRKTKRGQSGNPLNIFLVFIIIMIIIGIVMFAGFDYVPAGNIGVKDRMGVVDPLPWGPGIKWTGLLTSTEKFSTRIQLREYNASAASRDLQVVTTQIALNFKVNPKHAPEIYKTIGKYYQDIIISPIVQEAVKSSTAKYTAEDLIKERTKVKNDITEYITAKLRDKGLIVAEVAITDFMFSDEFNEAIEQKQVAEQNALTAKNKLDEMKYTAEAMKLQRDVIEIKKLDIEMEKLNVQKLMIEKWNGEMPRVLLSQSDGQGSNTLLNLDVKKLIDDGSKN